MYQAPAANRQRPKTFSTGTSVRAASRSAPEIELDRMSKIDNTSNRRTESMKDATAQKAQEGAARKPSAGAGHHRPSRRSIKTRRDLIGAARDLLVEEGIGALTV